MTDEERMIVGGLFTPLNLSRTLRAVRRRVTAVAVPATRAARCRMSVWTARHRIAEAILRCAAAPTPSARCGSIDELTANLIPALRDLPATIRRPAMNGNHGRLKTATLSHETLFVYLPPVVFSTVASPWESP